MDFELAPIASVTSNRLIAVASDGALRLVWDDTTFRIPVYDLPHLASLLEDWLVEEEPAVGLRRGYYRLCHGVDGGIQLWLNSAGLLLSREGLRVLGGLVEKAAQELCAPLCRQPRMPFGLGYRRLGAPSASGRCHN